MKIEGLVDYHAAIGWTDQASEGSFIWMDGEPNSFLPTWAAGQPDNHLGDEDCTVIKWQGENAINDAPCSYTTQALCKMGEK